MKWARKSLHTLLTMFITASVVTLILAFSGGCGGGSTQTKAVGNSTSGGLITASTTFDAYVRRVQKGIEPQAVIPSVKLEDAQKQVGIKAKFSKETLGGKLKSIYAETSASGNPEIDLRYSSSLDIGEEVMKGKPDYAADIAANAEENKKPGVTHIGADYHIVNVAGFEGKAKPPYEFKGYDGKTYKLPPDIYWWDNGIQYSIVPWKLGLTENQLMQVAESMYK